jgi:hypothetical protein
MDVNDSMIVAGAVLCQSFCGRLRPFSRPGKQPDSTNFVSRSGKKVRCREGQNNRMRMSLSGSPWIASSTELGPGFALLATLPPAQEEWSVMGELSKKQVENYCLLPHKWVGQIQLFFS